MDWNDPEEREAERVRLEREEDLPPDEVLIEMGILRPEEVEDDDEL